MISTKVHEHGHLIQANMLWHCLPSENSELVQQEDGPQVLEPRAITGYRERGGIKANAQVARK